MTEKRGERTSSGRRRVGGAGVAQGSAREGRHGAVEGLVEYLGSRWGLGERCG
jgi:hypothetical protein